MAHLKPFTVGINVQPHGLFVADVNTVRKAERMAHHQLAQAIANVYIDMAESHPETAGHYSRYGLRYWESYPKSVLCIVYCDIYPER